MSSRFAEINNAKWCKICSANILDGDQHPDLNAHYEADQAELKTAQQQEVLSKQLEATSSLIPVSSNDMLKHISQPSSPETLCGRPITDTYRPSTTDLVCDVCADLASSVNFINYSQKILNSVKESENNFNVTAVNYTRDGYKIDDDGFTVLTNDNSTDDFTPFSPFTYERTVVASEFDETDFDEDSNERMVYMGFFDEPIQFTAHWLEEDNEEPLFLPNDEF